MDHVEIRTKEKNLLVGYLTSRENEPLLLIKSRGKEDVIALKDILDTTKATYKEASLNTNICPPKTQ